MDDFLALPSCAAALGSPVAYRQGDALWVFAGADYQPSGWLQQMRERPSEFWALSLARILPSSTRRELLRRFGSATEFDPGRRGAGVGPPYPIILIGKASAKPARSPLSGSVSPIELSA